ncbi:hypothetical protein NU688_14910 [Variovorax sp. ZS18.2.2]|uniref:hypothetical protein n=1 Tax=Variovorax sp. ZS18.2.2 TaxID=2971255 RepID=UPI002150C458|nr:hypothetical protein [Variovorax sp. ZS18.2.2]MCR6477449.1 hypothetical protein [Variovorax sp. ZS18.2.2]
MLDRINSRALESSKPQAFETMANQIYHSLESDIQPLEMSNSLTGVIIEVIALATSTLATTDSERKLAVWLASCDQSQFGSGMVGFDVCKLPWSKEGLEDERSFLLRAIDAAQKKLGWEKLDFEPNPAHVSERLLQLQELIAAVESDHIQKGYGGPGDHPPEGFPRCSVDGVYLHVMGCVVCNARGV